MRRALLTLAVLGALATYAAAQPPALVRHVLPNGLVVLVREDPAVGVVAASLLVQSGSAFETSDTAGVTNFLQRAMLRGTRRHSALALAEAAEELGGALDASGDVDYAEVRGTAIARHWEALLALLAEVALEPTLPAAEIEKERALILGQLQTRADQPFPRAFDTALADLYGGHPYAWPAPGRAESVARPARAGVLHRRADDESRGPLAVPAVPRHRARQRRRRGRRRAGGGGPAAPRPRRGARGGPRQGLAPRQPRDGPPHQRAPRVVPRVLRAGRRRLGLARALRAGGGDGDRRRSRARGRALPGAADGGRVAAAGGDAVIPLRDDVPNRSVPVVTIVLIALNVLVYLYEVSLGVGSRETGGPAAAEAFLLEFGATPCRLTGACAGLDDFATPLVTVFTSMFMHSLNPMHLVGNMLYLWIFGDNVEDTLGHGRFLVFYLLAGVAAAVAQTLTAPRSVVPMIGASGAVSGVLGAYLVLFPYASILTLVGFAFFWRFVRVPALVMIGFWIVMQLLFGYLTVSASTRGAETGGVAWFAPIGGFLAGVVLLFLLRPPSPKSARL